MLAALGRIGGRAAKGAVAKKITSRVKAKTTKVSKDKLIGRSGSSTSMSSASPTTSPSAPRSSISTSISVSGDPLQSINQSLTKIQTLLKGSLALDQMRADQRRRQQQQQKAQAREAALETKKSKETESGGGGGGKQLSFMDRIMNFLVNTLLGFLAVRAVDLIPKLEGFLDTMKGVVQTIEDIAGTIFNGLVTFIDWGYSLYDNFRGWVGNTFGEDGLKKFDELSKHLNTFLNATLIACLAILKFQGVGGLISVAGKIGGGVISAGKSLVGFVAGGGAAAAGIVAGVGLLASGLGEGAFQLRKMGTELEEGAKKRYEEKIPGDPRKVIDGLLYRGAQFINYNLLSVGTLLDIVGAPFRYAVELIRYPFLSDEGRLKQRKNLGKFDARIRDQIRQGLEIVTFGMLGDFGGEGAFGGLFGDSDEKSSSKADKSSQSMMGLKGGDEDGIGKGSGANVTGASGGGMQTGPAGYDRIGAGAAYHVDTKFHQSIGMSGMIAAMDKMADAYTARNKEMVFSGQGYARLKAYKSDLDSREKKRLLSSAIDAHSHSTFMRAQGFKPFDYYIPDISANKNLYHSSTEGAEILLPQMGGETKVGSAYGGYGKSAEIFDSSGKMVAMTGHGDLAYARGGFTKAMTHRALLGEEGREFVIDADSTAALESQVPGFLYDLNKAKGREAVNVLRAYASYESGADETVFVPMPAMSGGSSGSGSKSIVPVPVGRTENSSFDTLYQGA